MVEGSVTGPEEASKLVRRCPAIVFGAWPPSDDLFILIAVAALLTTLTDHGAVGIGGAVLRRRRIGFG